MGSDCIGCGFCCRKTSCSVARKALAWVWGRDHSDTLYIHPVYERLMRWEEDGCPFLEMISGQ